MYKAILWINENNESDFQLLRSKYQDDVLIIGNGERALTTHDFELPDHIYANISPDTKFIFSSHGDYTDSGCQYVIKGMNSEQKISDLDLYQILLTGIKTAWLHQTGPSIHIFSCYAGSGLCNTNKKAQILDLVADTKLPELGLYIHGGNESIIGKKVYSSLPIMIETPSVSTPPNKAALFMQLIQDVPGDITLLQKTAFSPDVYEAKCIIPTNLEDIVNMQHYKDAINALNDIIANP